MIRKLFPPAGLLLVLCVAAQLGAAQTIEKRVVFAKGKYSATYAHKLPSRYADYDAYVLRAKKGQTLTVKLHADDPNAYISIYEIKVLGPDEDSIIGDIEYPRQWSGTLPITSEYSVQVYGPRSIDGRAHGSYTIEISIR